MITDSVVSGKEEKDTEFSHCQYLSSAPTTLDTDIYLFINVSGNKWKLESRVLKTGSFSISLQVFKFLSYYVLVV